METNTLGQRLRWLRERRGLRQEDVALHFHTGKSTISQWESGKRRPDIDTLEALARFYNTSVAYLLGETDDPRPPRDRRQRPHHPHEAPAQDHEQQLEYFLRGTGRLTDRDIKVILRLFEELARANEGNQDSEGKS